MEPRFDEVPRNCQNLFAITRLRCIYRGTFPFIFLLLGQTKLFIIPRTSLYRGSTVLSSSHARAWTNVILAGKRGIRRHSTTSHKWECRSGGNKLQNIRSKQILSFCDRERLNLHARPIKINAPTFLLKKLSFQGCLFFQNTWKGVKSNLFLLVVIVLES